TLVIAHRLWTIQHADMIVLLKDGRIEAKGTHHELLATSDFYRQFFASQLQSEMASTKATSNQEVSKQ
ncbi:MAG: multidrug ABC transporter permease, partial [Candidatus Sigynarchaeota archaeon]